MRARTTIRVTQVSGYEVTAMILVDLRSLVSHLNGYCTKSLEWAAGACLSRTNYEVTVEHFLAGLMEDQRADLNLILRANEIDPGQLRREIDHAIESFKTGNAAKPVFSPLLLELVQDAWLISSVNLLEKRIRSGGILLAFLARDGFFATGPYTDRMRNLNRDLIVQSFGAMTKDSVEATAAAPGAAAEPAEAADGAALKRFCVDFTARARDGQIDPVFGRDREIRQIVDILARRRKNNPIVVGDPGVGKTALVEGLALRVVQGDVPDQLRDVQVLGLDMGLLEAGAGVKGEFENRLNGVINGVKASPQPIILFIDEAHTLVGAGGPQGSGNAANLMKPALARGELRTIAATTWSEYKKYFEKDAALARRFQLVKLDEPSVEVTAGILRGLKDKYEEVHGVTIRDDAVVAAADLSNRYITGRQLPDKAVDLLDTAAARVKISLTAKPDTLEDRERRIAALERERIALERDRQSGHQVDEARLTQLELDRKTLENEAAQIREHWAAEKEASSKLLNLTKEATTASANAAESLRSQVDEARKGLAAIQGTQPIIRTEVDPEVIAKVVSDWTGIPLGKVSRDEAKNILELADNVRKRVRGQDQALSIIAEVIKSSKSGLKDPQQPIGVFLLVGPSGVGKTETALALADLLFGGEQSAVILNMSEFQEKHTVSRLVGSPPGYVGYGEGGVLTEAVRQRPYSVVLLDEVEKAHLDVLNLFYQVFDKGMLSDGEGREVDFKNTLIFLTSNLATDVISELCHENHAQPVETVMTAIRPILSRHFKPALLGRMTIAPYYTLDQSALGSIVTLKLDRIAQRLANNHRIQLKYNQDVVSQIASRCTEVETGARNVDFILNGTVMPKLSQEILAQMSGGAMPSAVQLGLASDGGFRIDFVQ
jgi:type VI secretion system protein VasG